MLLFTVLLILQLIKAEDDREASWNVNVEGK
jgi:hypothetical protein